MPRSEALSPFDIHNQLLEERVHPPDWANPTPDGRYNLVVIGAGTAGLVTAAGAAGLGAKVALVERELMGGDCLNVGCVPSKALIASARAARSARNSNLWGVATGNAEVDFPGVMERMRKLRAGISHVDSAARFRELGVDVFLGQAKFTDSSHVQVDGQHGSQSLHFKKAAICTGARAAAPPIPGLSDVEYLTNETLFSLTELPQRLAVIGAGPIGCEMAQTFANLGSEVLLVEAAHGVLPKEDPDAAAIVQESMTADGVQLLCCGRELQVCSTDGGRIRLTVDSHGKSYSETVDQLLVAVGRKPNVEGLGLEAADVEFDERKGVTVDDHLRTTNSSIFAAGDVCSKFQFTHAADFMARIVIGNSLFMGRSKATALTIPWATYTSPEIAHVGLYSSDAKEQGIEIDTYTQQFDELDRAILEGHTEGFARVHTLAGKDTIVGATIVAPHAGDLISEVTLAMTTRVGLGKLANVIHPYPTQAEGLRKLGDQYNKTRLTPLVKWFMGLWLSWTR
ncbi:mercuric reductase [Adhaeretor mobilis]|uniref:Mercuric reductase n=1 Tax=Adhaeretor mobilis TaxID=1930276 RepID=A0A517MZG8_9BACT|nr:mercuric reductase [Adhaeretor mobilis]QDT00281.1 Mercuric reductase [Adhaeretor mobilis]